MIVVNQHLPTKREKEKDLRNVKLNKIREIKQHRRLPHRKKRLGQSHLNQSPKKSKNVWDQKVEALNNQRLITV